MQIPWGTGHLRLKVAPGPHELPATNKTPTAKLPATNKTLPEAAYALTAKSTKMNNRVPSVHPS